MNRFRSSWCGGRAGLAQCLGSSEGGCITVDLNLSDTSVPVRMESNKLPEYSLNQPLVEKDCKKELSSYVTIEEGEGLRNGLELERPVSNKHSDLLRPSARHHSLLKGQSTDTAGHEKGKYTLIRDPEDFQAGIFDKPLPCFGCGIGWFSFLLGFVFPLLWYYATILYFGNYYRKDPRERAGLAASAIAAMACSIVLLIIAAVLLF